MLGIPFLERKIAEFRDGAVIPIAVTPKLLVDDSASRSTSGVLSVRNDYLIYIWF